VSKLFAALFILPAFCLADPVIAPSASGYYSQGAFEQAIAEYAPAGSSLTLDGFAGGQIQESGVSVSSDINYDGYHVGAGNGHFVPGAYQDVTQKYSTTVWTFSQPVYAFGGAWNLGPVNAGLQVEANGTVYFMPDGAVQPLSSYRTGSAPEWPSQTWSGFWGFVSSVPIDTISISFGDEGFAGSYAQNYSFSNMETVSAAPEPSALVLIVSGLLITVGLLRRKTNAGSKPGN
jgi:hypothetical protein